MRTVGATTGEANTVEVRDLRVHAGTRELVRGVDLTIAPGERVGLIGGSGSGKSLTAHALMGLLDDRLHATGSVTVGGVDVLRADERTMSRTRGRVASVVFQEPMTALNPLMTVGAQVAEAVLWHGGGSRVAARRRAVELLDLVRLPDPAGAARSFPHQLSGGQRQRVVIAIALANDPALLICDEPTTALDVTVQARVLDLVAELVRARDTAVLFISHDLAVVGAMTDRVAVMHDGRVVETGPVREVLGAPRHEHTRTLPAASGTPAPRTRPAPTVGHDALEPAAPDARPVFLAEDGTTPLIRARDLRRDYPGRRTGLLGRSAPVAGLRGVSFDVAEGAAVGVVGESGSGKSTLLRLIAGLDTATAGSVEVAGCDPATADRAALRRLRGDVSVVFQDPAGSLDPRMTVAQIVAEPLHGLSRAETADRVREVVASVGLPPDALERHPHRFSGGQRQRISIARALVTRPRILVADEPVSALDVSVRGQVLDLITELAGAHDLTLLFIAHDLDVVAQVCDRVLVLADGRIVEGGPVGEVYDRPRHPFTAELVAAGPRLADALRQA